VIIAVDGPAASGKGTLARALAEEFDLAYLDTGSLYRATAVRLLADGYTDPTEDQATEAANSISVADRESPDLRSEATGQLASKVAAMPGVRASLLAFQRNFAATPPNGKRGAVMDGRDIGTVVLPEADKKLFITATAEARAHRRFLEISASGDPTTEDQVLSALVDRDQRDAERAASPMIPAPDAYLLDTTELDIDATFLAAKAYISGPAR
jgi:cytidylate kinase